MDSRDLQGLMEAYIEVCDSVDEAVKGEDSERRKDLAAQRRAGIRPKSAKEGERYASHKLSQMAYVKRQRMGEEVEQVGEEMKPLPKEKIARQVERAYRKETRAAAAGDEKETNRQMQRRIAMQSPASRRTALQNKKMAEDFDIFDVVLEFLQVEGYAETLEEAEWLMANVIDEEAIGILIGEAQVANRDPDKYEREQAKKYAPVRGEKTPMPPRGDKRREDFEKWYAKNVR